MTIFIGQTSVSSSNFTYHEYTWGTSAKLNMRQILLMIWITP